MIKNNTFKVVLFAHDYVGAKTLEYVYNNYHDDISHIVLIDEDLFDNEIYKFLKDKNFPADRILYYGKNLYSRLEEVHSNEGIDYFILLWWPKIISESIINIPKNGVINLHPSYLPFCRGKDPNFWAIVEQTTFGVTIHKVQPGIDDGPIMF